MIHHYAQPARSSTFDAVVTFGGKVVHRDDGFPRLLDAVDAAAEDARNPRIWNLATVGEIASACSLVESVRSPIPIGRPTLTLIRGRK